DVAPNNLINLLFMEEENMKKHLGGVVFFVCTIALLGTSMLPSPAYMQSPSKKAETSVMANQSDKATWDALPTQVNWDKYTEFQLRGADSLSPEEFALFKKWTEVVESESQNQ